MRKALLATALLSLSGCVRTIRVPAPEAVSFRLLEPDQVPLLRDDLPPETLEAPAQASLAYLAQLGPGKPLQLGGLKLTPAEAAESVRRFLSLYKEAKSPEDLRKRVQEEFLVFQSLGMDGKGQVVFTAYYEPTLEASLISQGRFRFPLYRQPQDLVEVDLELFNPKLQGERVWGMVQGSRLVPYISREEIDFKGALRDKGLELAWLDNAWDVMTVHIQGSSRLRLTDGRELRAKFSASNGLPFKSPGMALVEMGRFKKDELNAAKVRQYLLDHPELERTVYTRNPRYTFFDLEESRGGPLGTIRQPLTAERSIAVDARLIPLGLPAYYETPLPAADPDGNVSGQRPAARFAFCQDTGGAIQGPGRVDIFMGNGPRAKAMAGRVFNDGRLFIFVRKSPASSSGR